MAGQSDADLDVDAMRLGGYWHAVPHFSTDIAQAFKAAEHLFAQGFALTLDSAELPIWRVTRRDAYGTARPYVSGVTAARAICIAIVRFSQE